MVARPPLAVPLLALAGFLALLALLVGGWAPLGEADTAVSQAFREYGEGHPDLVALLRIATNVAETVPFLLAGTVVTGVLVVARERRAATLTGLVTVAAPLAWSLLHWLMHRPRPEHGFVAPASNGFPSGHTTNAAAAGLVAVLLLWPRLARTGRTVVVVLAAAFAGFIGLTRVALLAHWPTDVLGGWLLALAIVPLAARVAIRTGPDRPAAGALAARAAPNAQNR